MVVTINQNEKWLCKECSRLEEKAVYEKVFKKIYKEQVIKDIKNNIKFIGVPGI